MHKLPQRSEWDESKREDSEREKITQYHVLNILHKWGGVQLTI